MRERIVYPRIDFTVPSGVGDEIEGREEAPKNKPLIVQTGQSYWYVAVSSRLNEWVVHIEEVTPQVNPSDGKPQ